MIILNCLDLPGTGVALNQDQLYWPSERSSLQFEVALSVAHNLQEDLQLKNQDNRDRYK